MADLQQILQGKETTTKKTKGGSEMSFEENNSGGPIGQGPDLEHCAIEISRRTTH